MKIWSARERFFLSLSLSLIGLLVLSFPYTWDGLMSQPLLQPIQKLIEAIGIAIFLSGIVSFGVEEVFRARTRGELSTLVKDAFDEQKSDFNELVNLAKLNKQLTDEIKNAHIKMVFSSRERGIEEMAEAIRNAKEFVYIMGISLYDFFKNDTVCYRVLSDKREEVEYKILLMNDQSLNALERSSREEGIKFTDVKDLSYKDGDLSGDIRKAIKKIQKCYPQMTLRLFDQQSLFLLITEEVAFMEPYHYGNRESNTPSFVKLAGCIPLLEFNKTLEKGHYWQLLGHFNYEFHKAKPPTEEHIVIK